MESLAAFRQEIDRLDDRILELLKARVNIAKKIAKVKFDKGLPIRDEQRERELLTKIGSKAEGFKLDPELIKRIFREIIELSVEAQKRP